MSNLLCTICSHELMEIDIGDVIKLSDGDIYEVTGVIHDSELVYFYQGGSEVNIGFADVDTLYKPQDT